MKLMRGDKVIVMRGRDRGRTGTVQAVLPTTGQVVVENINVVKRHTKPTKKLPRGGILDVTRPIDASKVMVLDPASGQPARIGYAIKADGSKERVFKVSPNRAHAPKPKVAKPAAPKKVDKDEKKPAEAKQSGKKS